MTVLWLTLLSTVAQAACRDAIDERLIEDALDSAEATFQDMDAAAFRAAHDRVLRLVVCLDGAATPELALRVHRSQGLLSFLDGDEQGARRAFAAARAIDPSRRLPRDIAPEGHPLHSTFLALPLDEGPTSPAPPGPGQPFVDGRPADRVSSIRPALAQFVDDGRAVSTTYLLPGQAWTPAAPDEGDLRSRHPRAAAWTGALLLGVSATSAAIGMSKDDLPEGAPMGPGAVAWSAGTGAAGLGILAAGFVF